MRDLVKPLEMIWAWAGSTLGLPGQMLFLCAVTIFFLALFIWIGNRHGSSGSR